MPRRKPAEYKCTQCGAVKPAAEFPINPLSGRRFRRCTADRERDSQRRKRKHKARRWDWANAMHKAQGMVLGFAKGTKGQHGAALTPDTLRALMFLQQSRCWLCGDTLCLPLGPLPQHGTLKQWRRSLSDQDRARVPVLVRISAAAPWVPGNVCFIAEHMTSTYARCGSVDAVRAYGQRLTECRGVVYQAGLISEQAAVLAARHMTDDTEDETYNEHE